MAFSRVIPLTEQLVDQEFSAPWSRATGEIFNHKRSPAETHLFFQDVNGGTKSIFLHHLVWWMIGGIAQQITEAADNMS